VYRANWIDGYIRYWDNKDQNWKRESDSMFVFIIIYEALSGFTSVS
jgi:hypothetical protein